MTGPCPLHKLGIVVGHQYDDRQRTVVVDLLGCLETIHIRHFDVGDHQIRLLNLGLSNEFLAGSGHRNKLAP